MTEPATLPTSSDEELLKEAVGAWRDAQVVFQSPSWDGQPGARRLAEDVARRPGCEPLLFELLADENRLVVAYALLALELMGSDKLASLPESLLSDRSNLSLHLGSFRNGTDLGGFARQIQKRAKARQRREPVAGVSSGEERATS